MGRSLRSDFGNHTPPSSSATPTRFGVLGHVRGYERLEQNGGSLGL